MAFSSHVCCISDNQACQLDNGHQRDWAYDYNICTHFQQWEGLPVWLIADTPALRHTTFMKACLVYRYAISTRKACAVVLHTADKYRECLSWYNSDRIVPLHHRPKKVKTQANLPGSQGEAFEKLLACKQSLARSTQLAYPSRNQEHRHASRQYCSRPSLVTGCKVHKTCT